MNSVVRVADWIARWAFRVLGAILRAVTELLARILHRGRFRPWRKDV